MGNQTQEVKVLLVSGSSPTRETAGSILKSFDEGVTNVELRAIGAGSVNQMFKASATARSIVKQQNKDLVCRPGYGETETPDGTRTVMIARLTVYDKEEYNGL